MQNWKYTEVLCSTPQDTFSSIRELYPNNSESFLSYLCVTADNGEDNEWRKCPNNLQKDRSTEEDI